MNKSPPKSGPTYDLIRKDLLICHQGRAWQVIQYSITIQTAFIAGWYYVQFEHEKPALALVATALSFVIMYLLKQALQRYNHLMGRANYSLNEGGEIYTGSSGSKVPYASVTSERIMLSILGINLLMAGFSLCSMAYG
ncbi:hypothetical protein [Vreelandella titanicae]|uniref:hypothetical protein n=1 Tax=Vreelandella titanicae TaxID=664683 RepID=UPI003FD7B921